MTEIVSNVWICAVVIAAGIAFHFVTKLGELETQGNIITPLEYWRRNPYTSLSVVMGAYLFLALQYAMGDLSLTGSIFIGIGCNSLGDKLRARAQAKL